MILCSCTSIAIIFSPQFWAKILEPFSFLSNVLPFDRLVSGHSEEVWTEMDTNCWDCNTSGRSVPRAIPRPARQRVIDKALSVFESSWS